MLCSFPRGFDAGTKKSMFFFMGSHQCMTSHGLSLHDRLQLWLIAPCPDLNTSVKSVCIRAVCVVSTSIAVYKCMAKRHVCLS